MTLAALAYAIHSGQEGATPDAIEVEHAVGVISQCLIQRIGMPVSDANQTARVILTLGEEDIGIFCQEIVARGWLFSSSISRIPILVASGKPRIQSASGVRLCSRCQSALERGNPLSAFLSTKATTTFRS